MSNKSAPTQRQRAEYARRKAMGIALIQRPLKYIKNRDTVATEENGTRHYGQIAIHAELAANAGRGDVVQRIARQIK